MWMWMLLVDGLVLLMVVLVVLLMVLLMAGRQQTNG
jgi:hypothetical protein